MTDLVQKLVGALEGLTAMYVNTWDLADGGLAMFSDRVKEFEKAHEAARAALSEAKAGGWVAVPELPTPEMLRAAVNAVCIDTQAIEEGDHISLTWDEAKDVFAAMLAARPLPAQPAQRGEG